MSDTKPCVVCRKHLTPVFEEGWKYMQPNDGGEIKLFFGYGSTKFDNHMTGTCYQGVICDECAVALVPQMTDLTGKEFPALGTET